MTLQPPEAIVMMRSLRRDFERFHIGAGGLPDLRIDHRAEGEREGAFKDAGRTPGAVLVDRFAQQISTRRLENFGRNVHLGSPFTGALRAGLGAGYAASINHLPEGAWEARAAKCSFHRMISNLPSKRSPMAVQLSTQSPQFR